MWDFDIHQHYRRLRCPVLMVPAIQPGPLSQQDETYLASKRKGVAAAQQIIEDLSIVWMPDTIHDIPLQKPVELGEVVVSFIERNAQDTKGRSARV